MVKKNIKYLLIVLFVTCISCDDWLTIQPKSEIDAETLFETPEGFTVALNGIYTNLSSASLYGNYLKYGLLDVLARTYTLNNAVYEVLETYDYSHDYVKNYFEVIWADMYNTIANCNELLERVSEKDSTFFPNAGKRMVEGEALTARALLYFDLLRLFAPAPVVADEAAIPYYDELTNLPMPYEKTSVILASIIDDLQKSKELQRGFDTSDDAISNYSNYYHRLDYSTGFFESNRRGLRLGYYTSTALLAQVALYAGNNELALENAMEFVDNSSLIDFTASDKIESDTYNRLLSEDIIFALYSPDFEDDFDQSNMLISNVDEIFGTDGDDFRKACYLEIAGDEVKLSKFVIAGDQVIDRYCNYKIPMFRLSQMYHIAIETLFDSNPEKSLELFTTLRTMRGCKTALPDIMLKSDLLTYLVNDARREFAGEGQMFYMYKRLNREIIDEARGNVTLGDKFVVPIPDRETSFTNN